MNIGDKVIISMTEVPTNEEVAVRDSISVATIETIVPVLYKDDGKTEWYEVCSAEKTPFVAIIGKDIDGEDVVVLINKETCDMNVFLDLL